MQWGFIQNYLFELGIYKSLTIPVVQYICLSLQGVFDHRMKCWQKWQDAQVTLQKKREAEAKLQLANKPDKLQQAKDEIKEVMLSNIILQVTLSALTHSFCINALLYTIFIYKSLICCFPYLLKSLKGIYLKY